MKKIILLFVGVIIIITSLFFIKNENGEKDFFEVTYIINTGEEREEYLIEASSEDTVFSLLSNLSEKENFELVSTKGVFVENIKGFENGFENKYWQYEINGSLGKKASDQKKVEENDKIEWKFDVSFF